MKQLFTVVFYTKTNNFIEDLLWDQAALEKNNETDELDVFQKNFTQFINQDPKNPTVLEHLVFDLLYDNKIQITFISNQTPEFDRLKIKEYYKGSDVEVHLIHNKPLYYHLTNIIKGIECRIPSGSKEYNRFFTKIFNLWKHILKSDHNGDTKYLSEAHKQFYIADQLEAILTQTSSYIVNTNYKTN